MRISDWSSDVCSSDLWVERFVEQAGLEAREQLLKAEQTLQLFGREPETRQLVSGVGVFIAARVARGFQRRTEHVAQVSEYTLGRGARAFEFAHHALERHGVARTLHQPMQAIDVFEGFHGAESSAIASGRTRMRASIHRSRRYSA